MTAHEIDRLVASMDAHVATAPVDVRVTWIALRGIIRRARRISSTTLPALADVAQHAIQARNRVDELVLIAPASMYAGLHAVRDHVVTLARALRTGASDEPSEDLAD